MTSYIFLAIAVVIIIVLLMAFLILVKQVRQEGRMHDLARINLMRDIRNIEMQTFSTHANVKELRYEFSGYLNSAWNPYLDSSHPSSLNNSRTRRRQRREQERRIKASKGRKC